MYDIEVVKKTAVEIVRRIVEGKLDAEVGVYGSSARGTYISENSDVDVFVVVRSRDVRLEDVVKILIEGLEKEGVPISLRYAQHPYVTAYIHGHPVDIVPCYKIAPGERPLSAADRTPLHHAFLSERLTEEMKQDVKRLKLFLREIGVYGAEIGGFSGFLAELLVVYYGSFLEVLRAASRWKPYETVISFTPTIVQKFRAPLVVVDPVDPYRNAAAAVTLTSMAKFIYAARRYLKTGCIPKMKESRIKLPALVVELDSEKEWNALISEARKIQKKLEQCGFKVYTYVVHQKSLIFYLEAEKLSEYVLHRGPPVYDEAVDEFIQMYEQKEEIGGPVFIGDRIYIVRKRSVTRVEECVSGKVMYLPIYTFL